MTPLIAYRLYWQHLPHTAETLASGSIIVTFGWARFVLKQDGERVRCVLHDDCVAWVDEQIKGMVRL